MHFKYGLPAIRPIIYHSSILVIVMKTPLRILLLVVTLAFVGSIGATDIVRIPAQYKKGALAAPDPEYPMKSQHLGYQGQGIYRLVINKKTGMADEIKVLKTTGHRELDASAVMTLLNWKFQPGTIDHRDVLIVFELTGWARGLH
jgi:TonB family protein